MEKKGTEGKGRERKREMLSRYIEKHYGIGDNTKGWSSTRLCYLFSVTLSKLRCLIRYKTYIF